MTIEIPRDDYGHIRVFQAPEALSAEAQSKSPEGLAELFGIDTLDPNYIDIIKIDDLSSMALTDYIAQGYDMHAEAHDIPAVNGIEGWAILVMSRASRGRKMVLKPASGIRHVTTYVPNAQIKVSEPLRSPAADGIIGDPSGKPPKSDARIGGMVAMVALLLLFALVAVMVWVGG
ncbi:hypothetical protein ACJ5NV_02435 [Loktanella agnita]|uniref:hypothetical protein n=1 Tax=Loktanella agnita TaxID=287097 RepID=UPI0039864670